MKARKAKGKTLINSSMKAIFDDLYQIDIMIKNDAYMGQQNYIIIRLVTITEQFFREIMVLLLMRNPDKRPKTIELDTHLLNNVVKAPNWQKTFMTERIISQSLSFQNAIDINESMRRYGKIQVFQNSSNIDKDGNNNGLLKHEYDKFFDTRHGIVHSIEHRPYLDVRKYYNMIENLFDYVLEKVGDYSFYEECKESAVLFQKNKANEYQKIIDALQGELKNEQDSATDAMKNKEYRKAIQHYNKVLELNPIDLAASMSKGLAFYYLEEYSQSIESFEQHLELYDDPVLYDILGSSLQKLGEHGDAMVYFKKTLEHESDQTLIYNKLSISAGSMGNMHEALKYAKEALAKKPDDEMALCLKKLAEEYVVNQNKQ